MLRVSTAEVSIGGDGTRQAALVLHGNGCASAGIAVDAAGGALRLDAACEAQTKSNGQRAPLQAFGKIIRSHFFNPHRDSGDQRCTNRPA